MEMFAKFEITELDKTSEKLVRCEIGESEESRNKFLRILKEKLLDVEGLNPCLDDSFLLKFLRVSKFDSEKAFKRIVKYYQHRKLHPSVYRDFYPSSISTAVTTRNLFVLPYRPEDNSVVLVCQRRIYDHSTVQYEEIVRMHMLALETLLLNPVTQMCGLTLILDFSVSATLSEYSPSRLQFLAANVQNVVVTRVKAIHIVNIPTMFYLLYSIGYPFFPKKIKERVIMHSKYDNWKSLHAHIPREILPLEYGGLLEKSATLDVLDLISEKEEYFRNQLQYGFVHKMKR